MHVHFYDITWGSHELQGTPVLPLGGSCSSLRPTTSLENPKIRLMFNSVLFVQKVTQKQSKSASS